MQGGQVIRQIIGQIPVLGLVPDLLGGIEFRGIGRQPRDPHQPGGTLRPQAAQGGTMHAPAIEDKKKGAAQVALEQVEEGQHVGCADIVGMQAKIEPQALALRGASERAADREAVMARPTPLNRGLSPRGPRPPARGLQLEAALVQQDEVSLMLARFFLAAARSESASAQWPPRPPRGRGARVFAGARATAATAARHEPGGSAPRSGGRLRPPREGRSITRWRTPRRAVPSLTPAANAPFAAAKGGD